MAQRAETTCGTGGAWHGVKRLLRNKALVTTAKIVLAVALLVWVGSKVDWQDTRDRLRNMNWWWFVLAFWLQCLVIMIGNHRLQILLRAQAVVLSYLATLKYNCIGYFFNVMLPGGTGGDVVKMYYVAREAPAKKAEIVTAILLDRFMGLLAVMCIAACALLATLKQSPEFRSLVPTVIVMLALSVAGGVLVVTKNFWRRYAWWRWVEERTPVFVRNMVNALHSYRAHKATAVIALAESLALQLLMCVIAVCYGLALRFDLPWYRYFIVFPVITLVLTIPVTPGGVGTTEGVAELWFKKLGQAGGSGIVFMLLLRMNILIMGIPGMILYMLPGLHVKRGELTAEAEAIAIEEEQAVTHVDQGTT